MSHVFALYGVSLFSRDVWKRLALRMRFGLQCPMEFVCTIHHELDRIIQNDLRLKVSVNSTLV